MGGGIGGIGGIIPGRGNIGLPRGSRICQDMNNACKAWAALGHCTKKVYYFYMTKFCCATCRAKMLADKAGPGGGTAPRVAPKPVAPVVKPVAPVVQPVAPVVKPVAPVVVQPKPVVPVVDLAAINAEAVRKATEAAKKQAAIDANKAEILKLVEAARNAAKEAIAAAERIAAARAVNNLNNNAGPAPNTNTN